MEAEQYVTVDRFGNVVIVGTLILVEAVGFAHEGGTPEEKILDWFSLNKVQLHGALAYFYGHRDEIMARIKETHKWFRKQKRLNRTRHKAWKHLLLKQAQRPQKQVS